jgi:hypothetical protein
MTRGRSRARALAGLRKRGRGAVLWTVGAFVVAQLGLGALAHTALPQLRDPMYFDKERRLHARIAAAGEAPVAVVMIGSSRTMCGFCAGEMEALVTRTTGRPAVVFNLGVQAAGPITNLMNLKRLMEGGVHPDLVLLELLPPLLTALDPPRERLLLHRERLSYAECEEVVGYGFPAGETRSRWREINLVPWYGLRMPLRGRFAPLWSHQSVRFDCGRAGDLCAWLPWACDEVPPEHHRAGVEVARNEYFAALQHVQPDGPAGRALRDGLALCRDRGVRAAVVLMPEGSEFREWYPPAQWAAVGRWLDGLGREYGVPIVDARMWTPDNAFSDSHHLLRRGARDFTERLGRDCVIPVLTGGQGARAAAASGPPARHAVTPDGGD